jgi:hypothetical protein
MVLSSDGSHLGSDSEAHPMHRIYVALPKHMRMYGTGVQGVEVPEASPAQTESVLAYISAHDELVRGLERSCWLHWLHRPRDHPFSLDVDYKVLHVGLARFSGTDDMADYFGRRRPFRIASDPILDGIAWPPPLDCHFFPEDDAVTLPGMRGSAFRAWGNVYVFVRE